MLIKNPNFLIFLFGALMVLFALLVDMLISSTAGMGFLQRAMLVIGGILFAFGLRRLVVPEQYKWDWLLVAGCGLTFRICMSILLALLL